MKLHLRSRGRTEVMHVPERQIFDHAVMLGTLGYPEPAKHRAQAVPELASVDLDQRMRIVGFELWKAELYEDQRQRSRESRPVAGERWVPARRYIARPDADPCTGCSASWCPICGDCICDREDGGPFDHPDCPLHADDSPHATGKVES